jgi:hypothetical protein
MDKKIFVCIFSGDQRGTYHLGDTIIMQAILYDAYGQAKTTGGDNIRGRMSSPDLKAYAPGTVKDHNNGTYSIIFEALWSGKAYITVTIAYTREAITAMYRLHLTVRILLQVLAFPNMPWNRYSAMNIQIIFHFLLNTFIVCGQHKANKNT